MVNEKAQSSKDKGNTAFKEGDYPSAIGHYTAAMLADKTDHTFPLNRAAAYLKLGKYEDAERDCTTVLCLSQSNVKALFRRGQARLSMGKLLEAQKDLEDVLLIEPSNTSAQEEMKKLTTLIQQEKAKKSKAPGFVQAALDSAAVPTRRRVPIKILDSSGRVLPTKAVEANAITSEAKLSNFKTQSLNNSSNALRTRKTSETVKTVSLPTKDVETTDETKLSNAKPEPLDNPVSLPTRKGPDTLQAVSSRSLKSPDITPDSPTKDISSSLPLKKSASFLEAKAVRESVKSGRVGGGIFRASGESTIFANGQKQSTTASDTPVAPARTPEKTYTTPSTLFEFTRMWNSLPSVEERWRYLKTIPPDSFPALCKTSLEPSLLISILETHLAILSKRTDTELKKQIRDYLENFSKVQRFETVVLFLNKAEKEIVKQVWHLLGVDRLTGVWKYVA